MWGHGTLQACVGLSVCCRMWPHNETVLKSSAWGIQYRKARAQCWSLPTGPPCSLLTSLITVPSPTGGNVCLVWSWSPVWSRTDCIDPGISLRDLNDQWRLLCSYLCLLICLSLSADSRTLIKLLVTSYGFNLFLLYNCYLLASFWNSSVVQHRISQTPTLEFPKGCSSYSDPCRWVKKQIVFVQNLFTCCC